MNNLNNINSPNLFPKQINAPIEKNDKAINNVTIMNSMNNMNDINDKKIIDDDNNMNNINNINNISNNFKGNTNLNLLHKKSEKKKLIILNILIKIINNSYNINIGIIIPLIIVIYQT